MTSKSIRSPASVPKDRSKVRLTAPFRSRNRYFLGSTSKYGQGCSFLLPSAMITALDSTILHFNDIAPETKVVVSVVVECTIRVVHLGREEQWHVVLARRQTQRLLLSVGDIVEAFLPSVSILTCVERNMVLYRVSKDLNKGAPTSK